MAYFKCLNQVGSGSTTYELTYIPSNDFGYDGDYAIVNGLVQYPYARNNGNNYVTFTGITGDNIYGIDIRIGTVGAGSNYYLAGTDGDNFCIGRASNGDSYMEYFIRANRSSQINFSHDFRLNTSNGNVYVNGDVVGTYNSAYPLSSVANSPFCLYSVNGNRISTLNVYYVKLYNSVGELILDATPTYDPNDVICFEDSVSGNYFYPNSGVLQYGSDNVQTQGCYKKINGEWTLLF